MIIVTGRTLFISEEDKFIGYVGDNLISQRIFKISDITLADFNFKLDLHNSIGGSGIIDLTKTTDDDGNLLLTWNVEDTDVSAKGLLKAQLRAFDDTVLVWHSESYYFTVGASINATESFPPILPSEFTTMEANVTSMKNEAVAAATTATEKADLLPDLTNAIQASENMNTDLQGKLDDGYFTGITGSQGIQGIQGEGIDTTARTEIVDAREGEISLGTKIGNIDTQLAKTTNYFDSTFRVLTNLKDNGEFIVIGDSISEGFGMYSDYNNQYITKLQNFFNSYTGYVDSETITNFSVNSYGLTFGGSKTIGTRGASQKSIILPTGSSIRFTGAYQYIDVLYHRNPSAGQLQVWKGSTLVKTIDCSGVDTEDVSSFPTLATGSTAIENYSLTCINASIEITGLIRLVSKSSYGNANVIRCAVSGQDSAYFSTDAILASIMRTSNIISSGGVYNKNYLLAIGVNDIYNNTLKKSSTLFYTNMKKIIDFLLNDTANVKIILTVPAIPNNTYIPYEAIQLYRNKIYRLSNMYNLKVIDYSNIDFVGLGLTIDGLHPNANGHEIMYEYIIKTISNGLPIPTLIATAPITPYLEITAAQSAQAPASGTLTSITFANIIKDTNSFFNISSPTVITINTTGFYEISASIEYSSNATGIRGITIYKGSSYYGTIYTNATASGTAPVGTTIMKYFNAGDTFDIQAYQTSGGTLNVLGARVSVCKLSD